MAKPPAGPIGNSPRDTRDDAVGVSADNVTAPEPMRWPPKPKKVKSNTFHAKVSGGTPPKRADRKPHFRRGGFVKGYAAGGPVEKNDPGELAKKGLKKGGVAKRQEGGVTGPTDESRKEGISKLSSTMKKEVSFRPGEAKAFDNPRTQSANISRHVRPGLSEERGGFKKGGPVGSAGRFQGGGEVSGRISDFEPKGGWKAPDKKWGWPSDLKPPEKIPDDWRRLGPEPKPPPPREEPKKGFLEREYEKGQAVFGPKRKTGGAVKKRQSGGYTDYMGKQNKLLVPRDPEGPPDLRIKTWPSETGRPQRPGKLRSESTEHEKARREIGKPVTDSGEGLVESLRTMNRAGPYYKDGGKLKK